MSVNRRDGRFRWSPEAAAVASTTRDDRVGQLLCVAEHLLQPLQPTIDLREAAAGIELSKQWSLRRLWTSRHLSKGQTRLPEGLGQ